MPLIVKDYSWMQNEQQITIRVPLKGVPASKVDIFTCDNYIKANYPPFLFEIFLSLGINETNSKCIISDNEIIFELQKTIPQHWEALSADISKMEMLEKRKAILEKYHQRVKEEEQSKKEKLASLQRISVQHQIDRDTKTRKEIEEKRNLERNKAMDEFEEWKLNKLNEVENQPQSSKTIFEDLNSIDEDNENETQSRKPVLSVNELVPVKQTKYKTKDNLEIFPIPLPRESGSIRISFTHREFPTPSRESQAPQEEEWLKKQVEARRATGFVAEDLRPEECNPSWLKDKGDSFYRVGNYLGAVSAYSHAIKLGSKMASLYSNRAAAHLGLGNLHKALDDCSQALELMTPHVSANLEGRAKCHARRGAVLCRLGLPEAGLADFEEALKLKPNDSKLLADIEHAKYLIKNKPEEEEKFDGVEIIPS